MIGKKTSSLHIITSSIMACLILYFIEQGIGVSYITKTSVKIFLFAVFPIIYIIFFKNKPIKTALNIGGLNLRKLSIGILSGIIFFSVILVSYSILGSFIDFDKISLELQDKLRITPLNFIFVGVYITLGNSFLEEFFFRGYIFMNLYELGYKRLSYIFSSFLFAFYHIIIFKNWFTPPIFLLALIGLASVGFIFNWMDTKSKNFINSWISHILADSAIILIGLKMFKII